jgi:hypothetical protein
MKRLFNVAFAVEWRRAAAVFPYPGTPKFGIDGRDQLIVKSKPARRLRIIAGPGRFTQRSVWP